MFSQIYISHATSSFEAEELFTDRIKKQDAIYLYNEYLMYTAHDTF
jgi:hypothetical protein